ncbi:MAG TPA: isoprenylcysteine carboxylmethyltransferase family protein [Pyrinomonadaceae bacterium]|jgi:protein-S-isoprenylcysteine O-methyltransferase Ste14
MSQPIKPTEQTKWMLLTMLVFMLIYLALMLACLRQWGAPTPWSRINFFSGTAIVLSLLLGAEQILFTFALPKSGDTKREAFGITYDPGMATWVTLLSVCELVVFLDYGHLHLMPSLERGWLQGIGLGFYVIALVLLRWTDAWLARNFARSVEGRELMTDGPFRYLRHPRYAGLLISRIAFALVFASILGWLLVLGWILAVHRRINLEEPHLQKIFGQDYEAYARRTSRFLPGIY